MLASWVYAILIGAPLLAAISLCWFRAGRALLLASLPAIAFFALLLLVAEITWRIGFDAGVAHERAGGATGQVYTCSMHPQVRQPGPGLCPICHMELTPLDAAAGEPGAVTIDPVVVQNMGVRVHTVARGPLRRSVRAFGTLRAAEPRLRDIALKFDGFVERLFAATEGMRIERGQELFAVYAPDLIVAQEELIAARQSGDPALLAAARQKLLLWDVPERTVDELQAQDRARRTLTWTSPVQGTLLRRDVVEGAPAGRNEVLLRIVDLSVLWLDAQLPESQLALVREGMPAHATFAAAPGHEVEGLVVFVAPALDEAARTATVRVEVPNAELALKPGMFARLVLAPTVVDDALLVPQEAVLDTGIRQLAWVAQGKGRFESRAVRLGARGDDGMVAVLDGLTAGEHVVTSGQFLIDAESRLREGSRKLDDQGLLPGGELPPPQPVQLSAPSQQHADALLAAYLQVTAAFAGDQHDDRAWQAMTAAATALAAAPEAEVQLRAGELAARLQAASGDVVAHRIAFKQVSAAAIALFELARPGAGPGPTLFVHHCPMVKADWLQLDAATRNPYDTSMLQCGEVVRTLPLGPAAGNAREAGK
jgi:Cu(I)/Ag(I) efflux system membrane fusion protein